MKIGVCSLGCDKNRIDTENMLAYMQQAGYEITAMPQDADIIVVNTCGFIDSAKQEAIETILDMAQYKKDKCKYLIVSGCLTQRYMQEVAEGFEEVDAFIGTTNYHNLPSIIERLEHGEKKLIIQNDKDSRHFSKSRVLTTPYHYAYLKIAEGCDNKCTYCAIPKIRGKYTSRPIQDLIEEANQIVNDYGVKELIIVAQDVSKYGIDLYGEIKLIELLEQLSAINEVEWIRLLYLYPEQINDELLEYISKNSKICKYLDIPCQHISDKILKMMNRKTSSNQIYELIKKIRSYGDFVIRSTFIVGFPQESEQDFEQLKQFVEHAQLDRCGFFAYSREEGTPADLIKGHLPEELKLERQAELYQIQEKIMLNNLKKRIGKTVQVIYEGIDYDKSLFFGRTSFDAPEIDTKIYFTSKQPLDIGNIYNVKINAIDGIDSIGEII